MDSLRERPNEEAVLSLPQEWQERSMVSERTGLILAWIASIGALVCAGIFAATGGLNLG